jgi:HAD superfamily hydrolase (TIGR01509 family)
MPQAVIFDIDGTLVDSVKYHAEAWVKAMEAHGYQADFDKMSQQIGKGGEFIMPEFISEAEVEKDGEAISDYRKQYYQENLLPKVKPFPQVKPLFERLRADQVKIVLASSARPDTVEYYKGLLEVGDLIEGVTSTGDVEKAKPNPDIFEAAMSKLNGISVENTIVVGDSPYDAQAACKISLRTIGVLCGGFAESVLREAGCFSIYRDPADLLANYEQSPLKPDAA